MKRWSVVSASEKGFTVVSAEGHRALLPHSELSDMPGITDIVSKSVKSGTVLEELVCISTCKRPFVSFNYICTCCTSYSGSLIYLRTLCHVITGVGGGMDFS